MRIKDTVTTKYLRQNMIFADLFNYFLYGGEQVIDPNSLEELDTRQVEVPYGGEKGAGQPVQRTRDVIKSVTAMTDKRAAYLLLAIESQAHVHYAAAVKNMVYDALQYARQVEQAIASHKLSGDYQGVAGDEFLSGFMKSDRLLPVVTLMVFFGPKEWDGPLSIHEMFAEKDAEFLSFVPDYKVNLIAPALMADDDFSKLKTTLREVLSFIKYSDDKGRLSEVLAADEGFRHLGRNEINVLNACVGAKLTMNKGEKEVDMCKALEDMKKEAAEEADKRAEEADRRAEEADRRTEEAKRRTEEAERKAEETKKTTILSNVKNLMEKMGWSFEQSVDVLDIAETDRKQLSELLNKI